jgi:hypothetical protein
MTPAKATQMGFRKDGGGGNWMRNMARPRCREFWSPSEPNVIRREWYSSDYQARPNHLVRKV